MDVTFDKLSHGTWDEAEARDYLHLLLRALGHTRKVRALFMDVLLTHDDQQDEYDKLQAQIETTLAKKAVTPEDLEAIYHRSQYQPNLENSLSLFGRFGLLEPQPGWAVSWQANREDAFN